MASSIAKAGLGLVSQIDPFGVGPVNNYVAAIGDSRIFQETSSGSRTNVGYIGAARNISRQAFIFRTSDNFGVNAETSTQIVARLPAALAQSDAAIWVIGLMLTNDSSNSVPLATSLANIDRAIDLVTKARRKCVILAEAPCGDAAHTGQRKVGQPLREFQQIHDYLLTKRDVPNVRVVNMWSWLADPTSTTGDYRATMSYDGLHQGQPGAYGGGELLAEAIMSLGCFPQPFLETTNTDLYNNPDTLLGSLVTNPMLDGTGGTINAGTGFTSSGSLATSWQSIPNNCSGLTAVYSKVSTTSFNGKAYPNGLAKSWQQIAITGTPTQSNPNIELIRQAIAGLVAGYELMGTCEIEIDAGTAGVTAVALQFFDTSSLAVIGDQIPFTPAVTATPSPSFMLDTAMAYTMLVDGRTVVNPSNERFTLQAYFIQNTAVNLTIRVRAMSCRRVL